MTNLEWDEKTTIIALTNYLQPSGDRLLQAVLKH